jgi:hypothetical protein
MPGEQSIHFTAARFHARCSPSDNPSFNRSYTGAMSLKSALRSPAADELCSKGFPATSSSFAIARARRDARCGVEKGRCLSVGGDENRPRGARDARDRLARAAARDAIVALGAPARQSSDMTRGGDGAAACAARPAIREREASRRERRRSSGYIRELFLRDIGCEV